MKLSDCQSVESYVDKMVTMAGQLDSSNLKVPDKWLAALLLKGLPDTYKPMIMAIEHSGVNLTADLVKSKILQDMTMDAADSNALYANKGKKNQRQKFQPLEKKQQFKPKFCSACGKP